MHDRYGHRTIEHDPYHHEFVHGTNYEIDPTKASPVVEHNPHAFGHDGNKKQSTPAPATTPKKEGKKAPAAPSTSK